MQNILIINSGSSSLKFQLIEMPSEKVLASGLVERIGQEISKLHYSSLAYSTSEELSIPDHSEALKRITDFLLHPDRGVIREASEIPAISHRVVHGGAAFSETLIIDEKVKSKIKNLFSLAPLHNPPNLKGIEVAEEIFPQAKQIAVFDTAFHRSIPAKANHYAIPLSFLEENHIQVYGFHGTSHKYVSEKAIEKLQKKDSKIITVHLGNGCSITAVQDGKSVDHSLGFGPVNGLIMGTRSGDIDQSVIFYLIEKMGYTAKEVSDLLHHKSGMLGLTGFSDLRDIEAEAEKGNHRCQLALEMNAYRIKKYIGSYTAAMNGLDAIVFTAGIGENSSKLRSMICSNMDFLGISIDEEKNKVRSKEIRNINNNTSKVRVFVIPTNEELEIAKQSYSLIFG
ncbi:acetate kinase [Antarcticibacterium sp. 1MA-6-2]|uniref:acetate/propionate family kinase n=1 Tax=Antarcticibacterium sp. 1MA-6-2 TaxID=2908210 RepID=UPI001F1BF3D9|nr:acetate kinase [Antarcticibacterium sp. 1MA-6-2]UJH91800.1 acetate kinase [Antarcticibacterium sp. 1MA-6-2]